MFEIKILITNDSAIIFSLSLRQLSYTQYRNEKQTDLIIKKIRIAQITPDCMSLAVRRKGLTVC